MKRRVQIQSRTPGAEWTKKRKGNFSQQPQEQWIKSPQSTSCTLHLCNTWIDYESSQIEEVDFGSNDIYIYFFPFCLFVSVYVYASVCDFVCIALLLPFVLGFCLSVFLLLKNYFSLHNYFLNNYILFYFTLLFIYFILSSSFFPFFSLLLWAMWRTGSWCSSQASGLCHRGGRANFRTLVHKRPPSST